MTVKKATRCGGFAALVARQKLHNTNQQIDIITIAKAAPTYNVIVSFNDKDQLQLTTKDETSKTDDEKMKHINYPDSRAKPESILIDDINNCENVENYPNCGNTLVFYVTKNFIREAIALKFENNQDFKRIYFTYKYFKMRNRLTHASYGNTDHYLKKKTYVDTMNTRNSKNSADDYSLYDKSFKANFEFTHVDNDSTHMSLQPKGFNSRYDQPMSLIGIRNDFGDSSEIDSIIYIDVETPPKPEKKRLFQRNKTKALLPPSGKDNKVLKGEFVRVNVDRTPDVIPRDNKVNRTPDILMIRDSKPKVRTSPTRNLWSSNNKVLTGYESDREEWRSSRSQFSTTAFDSLARPTKLAMALTLKKPQRIERIEPPQYYRIAEPNKLPPMPYRQNNFAQRPRMSRPPIEVKRNPLTTEHRKFTSLQNLDMPKKILDKKPIEVKKTSYTFTNRITGLTNKLRELHPTNTIGRFKAQSHGDVANLKPALKAPDPKRPVMRTCSAEPPKKVTFSAFATVQVV